MITDPHSERFDVDRDWKGEPTKFGLMLRNLKEEERAMKAGLAPGQVRRGLRQMSRQRQLVEEFAAGLGHEMYLANPWDTTTLSSWSGRDSTISAAGAKWSGFIASFSRVASSSKSSTDPLPLGSPRWRIRCGDAVGPFMMVSWDRPWSDLEVRMFKRVGYHAGICTFLDARVLRRGRSKRGYDSSRD